VLGLLVVLLALTLAGCGGGSMLTGGSVPIGDVDGWVYRGTRGSGPASGASVQLLNRGGHAIAYMKTDARGYFRFAGMRADSPDVTVLASQSGDRAQMDIDFDAGERDARVALVLDDGIVQDFGLFGADSKPSYAVVLGIGQSVTVHARGIVASPDDPWSAPIPVSWAVKGELGDLTMPDPLHAVFTARKGGGCTLTAQHGRVKGKAVAITIAPFG
jgi:hypothetical protein